MISNRLDFIDDNDIPPLREEDIEELEWKDAFEEAENQRKMELYGPRPGRWETEWGW